MTSSRLPPLSQFSGKEEYFDSSNRKLNAYFIEIDETSEELFNVAETHSEVVTDSSFVFDGVLQEDKLKLSRKLYYTLVQQCNGTSEVLLSQLDTKHGVEAWRHLHQYYKRPSMNTSMIEKNEKTTQ